MKLIPEITAERENFRMEPMFKDGSMPNIHVTRRDPVEPVPVGTYVAMIFRVTGYDQDCDGSLMARFAAVNKDGEESGWCPGQIGIYPDGAIELSSPDELHRIADELQKIAEEVRR